MLSATADVRAQVERIRYEANEFWFNNGYSMPTHALAKRIADLCQINTQEASSRALAVLMIFIGYDDEKGAQLYKVDLAGHFLPYKAVASGKCEQEAMNFLEKKVTELSALDEPSTVEMAIMTMQHVLSSDFKGSEVEVGVVTKGSKYRVLTEAEIEERVNAIQDKSDT
jgi:20S proteasome subunit alpha 1